MAHLNFTNDGRFVFAGQTESKTLLDCQKLLDNKSRMSMHRLPGQDHAIIPELLAGLLEKEQKNGEELAFPMFLTDVLLAARLIRTSSPLRVLEYGCGDGRLSWHLAELLGAFHDESVLVCAHNTIEPEWMERMSYVEKLPKLSFLAGDYGQFTLEENFFDIVILNGLINFQNPCEAIADALRFAKAEGMILCYTNTSPLLESTFKLFFERREEYAMDPSQKILLADVRDACWSVEKPSVIDMDAASALVDHALGSGGKAAIETIKKLKSDIEIAVKLGQTDKKIQLLEQKERLLEYVTGEGPNLGAFGGLA